MCPDGYDALLMLQADIIIAIDGSFLPSPLNFTTMTKSSITIDVELDANRVPENIEWRATESTAETPQKAKAMMVSFWDGQEKTALRIDLWTQKMMVDEMADFYYQTFITMADTFERATRQAELVNEMKAFAHKFYDKFRELQMRENKAG